MILGKCLQPGYDDGLRICGYSYGGPLIPNSNFSAAQNLIQCIIPCIAGLVPRNLERYILDMLWYLQLWYSLVKLRLQSKSTIFLLSAVVHHVEDSVHKFQQLTEYLDTQQLP